MSKNVNSFALLDDSDDEAPKAVAPAPAAKKETKPKTQAVNKERRRPNNNDRNTKGGRGPRNARDGKRTYDRRSGTGRGKEIKKGGGGGRNWGSDKNEARKNEGPVDDNGPAPEEDARATAEEGAAAPAAAVEPEPEPEPEDTTMTMEEYLAAKSSKAAGDDLFGSKNEREVDASDFAGKEAHKAVEGDFLVMGGGKSLRKKSGKKEVTKLDVNFKFTSANDSRPRREGDGERRGGGRGGRGGRGRGSERRGGRGRGGGRGGGRRSGSGGGRGGGLKVDDVNAFPSL